MFIAGAASWQASCDHHVAALAHAVLHHALKCSGVSGAKMSKTMNMSTSNVMDLLIVAKGSRTRPDASQPQGSVMHSIPGKCRLFRALR